MVGEHLRIRNTKLLLYIRTKTHFASLDMLSGVYAGVIPWQSQRKIPNAVRRAAPAVTFVKTPRGPLLGAPLRPHGASVGQVSGKARVEAQARRKARCFSEVFCCFFLVGIILVGFGLVFVGFLCFKLCIVIEIHESTKALVESHSVSSLADA